MSTGGRRRQRVAVSLYRRVATGTMPPRSCIFPVLYTKSSIVRRCHAPPAGGLLSPRPPHGKQKDGRLTARLSVAQTTESSVVRLLFRLVGVFLARLAVLALQRGAEDVAEAGTRIGGAVIGHRLLLLLDLARLDRERQLARRLVDRRHLGVDLLADGEAVGALLAAVARQVRLADEARHAVADRDLDAAIGDRRDSTGDDRPLLQRLQRRFMRVGGELLDAEADALLLDIDVQHLDLDHMALGIGADRLLARLGPVEGGELDHAVDLAVQADSEAGLRG